MDGVLWPSGWGVVGVALWPSEWGAVAEWVGRSD